MGYHSVQQGECLSLIAKNFGFASWRTIYDHPENAAFRKLRPNPNVLLPGDRIYVPEKEQGAESAATGQSHQFKLASQKTKLTIKVAEHVGPPLGGRRYSLKLGDDVVSAAIPPSGIIDHDIPVGLSEAELKVTFTDEAGTEGCYQWTLRIGHLDPIDTVTGLQARLNNLGFYSGPVDGDEGPVTRTAIRQFQREHGLVVDEIAGPKTRAKLKEVYGC